MDNMHSRASFKLKLYVSILWMVLIEIFLVLGSGPCRKMPNVAWNAVNATNNLYWSLVFGQPIYWHSCIWHKIGLPCPMVFFIFLSLPPLPLSIYLSIYWSICLISVLTSLTPSACLQNSCNLFTVRVIIYLIKISGSNHTRCRRTTDRDPNLLQGEPQRAVYRLPDPAQLHLKRPRYKMTPYNLAEYWLVVKELFYIHTYMYAYIMFTYVPYHCKYRILYYMPIHLCLVEPWGE